MKIHKILAPLLLSALALTAGAQSGPALKVGIFPGAMSNVMEVTAQEARKQGLDVKLIEFSDWVSPNAAVDSGELDANFFQHQAFLDQAVKQRGFKLKSADIGVLTTIGLFSKKVTSLQDIKPGQTLAIFSDASNQARSLKFLEQLGLVKLKPGLGESASLADVVSNPKQLKFIEVEGPQLVRSFEDVDLAIQSSNMLSTSGRDDIVKTALAWTKGDDLYYAARFVTHEKNVNDPRVKKLIKVFHESPAVRQAIHAAFKGNSNFYSLPWLKGKVQ